MVLQFQHFGLQPQFMQAIEQMGFEQPTPIQAAAIPVLMNGNDVVGQAQTGTGKTAAYVLPMLQMIQPGLGKVQALVLAPTRELAIQVSEAARRMASGSPVNVLPVYGGQSYEIQIRQLKRGMDIVVGTPGRLLDLIQKNILDLSEVRYLVLDEADEMLEMGFIDDVETIMAQVPSERQMALFSATMPDAIRKMAERYLRDPQKIAINPSERTVAETEQRYCRVREEHKLEALVRLFEVEEVKGALIFTRTKARAQDLSENLLKRGLAAEALHGDLNQARREFVLNRFRQGIITLLVATDVAARGLDIDDISHVINYDIPGDVEDYVHRIGRTGRAGRKGVAVTLVTPRERSRLGQIEAYTRKSIAEFPVPTRADMLARRDERFIQQLTERLGKGSSAGERALLGRLAGASFDMIEIAAAAIQLARASEGSLPGEDILEPVEKKPQGKAGEKGTKSQRPGRDSSMFPRAGHHEVGSMVRLWMNLGGEHGLRPSDVVGAIASEVGIPGRAIGEINILRDHSLVDVAERHVRQVLKRSNGKYFLRGKPVMLKLAR
ncbi:MAG TPA: DEAD/DEAH box helicase [Levilinea sp.]|nr:DEAD/DEAH box helicase [Levilinea sp.]